MYMSVYGDITFNYNSDISGPVRMQVGEAPRYNAPRYRVDPAEAWKLPDPRDNVVEPESWTVEIPGDVLVAFVVDWLRQQKVSELERASTGAFLRRELGIQWPD